MKKKSTSKSAFFNLRVLVGLLVVLAGVLLALFAWSGPRHEGTLTGTITVMFQNDRLVQKNQIGLKSD